MFPTFKIEECATFQSKINVNKAVTFFHQVHGSVVRSPCLISLVCNCQTSLLHIIFLLCHFFLQPALAAYSFWTKIKLLNLAFKSL